MPPCEMLGANWVIWHGSFFTAATAPTGGITLVQLYSVSKKRKESTAFTGGHPKGYKWKISYVSSVSAAHAEYTATNVIPPIGTVADVKSLPCHISQFAPYISQGANISSPH